MQPIIYSDDYFLLYNFPIVFVHVLETFEKGACITNPRSNEVGNLLRFVRVGHAF